MAILTQIKTELNKFGIKPKKSLGQNFLINEGVYNKIIAAAEIKKGDRIIEVGPGLGTLTQYLVDIGAEILAVEKDHQLAEYLKIKFAGNNHVTIVEEDILKFNPSDYSLQTPKRPVALGALLATRYKLAGNIPYYLTSRLLRIVFENWPTPELIVLMLQKEVAQRIVAKPPKMSLLAVSIQYYTQPKIISYVSKSSFWPSPKVDSAIIKFEPKASTYHLAPSTFFQIVRAGFTGKRKQLGTNLARELKLTKDIIEKRLKSIDIDPKRRAETLTINEWQKITNTFVPRD